MAGELEKLLVRLDADTTALRSALLTADKATSTWESKTNKSVAGSQRVYESFGQTVTSVLTKFGAILGGIGAVNFGATMLADAASLANLATSAGLSTDALQTFRFASRSAGVETQTLDSAVSQFAGRMGEYRSRLGEFYTFMRDQLPQGKALLDNTRSQSEAFEAAARIVANLASAEDKATFVKKAFGDAAVALIPVFEKLAKDGFDATAKKAREYGAIIDKEAIEESKRLKIELDVLYDSIVNTFKNGLGHVAKFVNTLKSRGADGMLAGGMFGGADLDNIKAVEKELAALQRRISDINGVMSQQVMPEFVRKDLQEETAKLEHRVFELTNRLATLRGNGAADAVSALNEVGQAAKSASGWVTTLESSWQTTTEKSKGWAIAQKPNFAGSDAVKEQHIARLEAEGSFTTAIGMQYEMQVEKFRRMLDQELISEQEFLQAREDANIALAGRILSAYQESTKFAVAGMNEIKSAITGPVMSAFDQWMSTGKLKAQDLFASILASLAKVMAQALILKPIMDSLFSGIPGGSGFFSLFGGFRAEGGPVSASRPYVVGEKGPELFVPNAHGSIVPNNRLGARGGMQSNVSIDARGADIGAADRIMQAMRMMMAMQQPAPAAVAAYGRRFPARKNKGLF